MSAIDVRRDARPAPGPLRPYHFPTPRRHVLANGLQVVAAEVHAFPVVTVGIVLPSGAVADPVGKGGLASLTIALLESGAAGQDTAQIARRVDGLGLSMESFASWDLAEAGFTCLAERLDAGLGVLADMVLRPEFPEAEVERLRAQRLGSLRQTRAEAGALATEVAMPLVYGPNSQYARPMGGTIASVSSIGREDVAAFHDAHYRPQGATLFAAGDVTLEELVALAERHFAGWSGAQEALPDPGPLAEHSGLRFVVADRPGSVQSAIRMAHRGPARGTPDYFGVLVMNAILGGTFSSRINLNLRERLGYTYGASTVFVMRRSSGLFTAATAVQTEVTAPSVAEILRDVRGMRESAASEQELSDARTYLAGSFPVSVQTTDGVAAKLETLLIHGLPDDYYDTYRERILAVGADEVLAAARAHLLPEAAVVVVAGDAARVAPELEALGQGPVEVVDPAEVLD
ncbi:MAG TPA: pitrilysin family protein [Longimicrobiaceae bacterium]|nr:pitrilysin family protein [Longimicrobiaceae bacterium]